VHIHVPAGAIPKDGPSAGVTMATALVSALSRRPARHDIAMTGEVTLRGRVLPIGGVKEKVLGAVRAGIKTIILPKENAADLEDLPEEVRNSLDVHLVEELGDVLTLALRGRGSRRATSCSRAMRPSSRRWCRRTSAQPRRRPPGRLRLPSSAPLAPAHRRRGGVARRDHRLHS